jgi:tRNA threonylcarbamoyladenosine modification (KEOPS) complex  Pcc1 subunit
MLKSNFELDFKKDNKIIYKLLKEEDYNFKTKNINIDISYKKIVQINIEVETLIDLKIANNSLIQSLEIIQKTLKI